jgi:hypothetical protein
MSAPDKKTAIPQLQGWRRAASGILLSLLSKLLSIPVFIWVYRMLPYAHWPYYLDRILLFLLVFAGTYLLLRIFRKAVLPLFIITLATLLIGSLSGGYGFKGLWRDYSAMVYAAIYDPAPVQLSLDQLKPFPNERPIRRAIQYRSPEVRRFALYAINKHFRQEQQRSPYRQIIQCFAIFKEINTRWNYVNDPRSRDYYAPAPESLRFLSGDCDDHSTAMAACLLAVGAKPRLVLTTKHIYPELYIGDRHDLEHINLLIRNELFPEESRQKRINYHIDGDGKVWINLDYTARYPGGEFLHEAVLGLLVL